MLCQECNELEATIHLSQDQVTGTVSRHYCELCTQKFKEKKEEPLFSLFASNEEFARAGWFHATGQIEEIGEQIVVLVINDCSHFPPGHRLRVRKQIVPESQLILGGALDFAFPPDERASILVE